MEEKSYNSWRHNLLYININALKSFSLAAHIWRAEENICVCVCVCVDSDSVFLTLKITGGRDESLPSVFHDAMSSRQ